jgi:BlaI family transcriptional regulator, penicillinase repressor
MAKSAKPREKVSRREREIMHVLFALGNRAAAEEIRLRLTDPPSSSAVRAMLARLESKGYLRHREEGLRYVYSPTTRPEAVRRKALQDHLQVFFGGSAGEMATALLRQESWTDDELDALQSEIERIRNERKES